MRDVDDKNLFKMYEIEKDDVNDTEKPLSVTTTNELFRMRITDIFNPYSRFCKPTLIEVGLKEQPNLDNKLPFELNLENKLVLESKLDIPVLNQQTNLPLDHKGLESAIINENLDPNQNQVTRNQNNCNREIKATLAAFALTIESVLLLILLFWSKKKKHQIDIFCGNMAIEEGTILNRLYLALQLNLHMCLKGIRRLFIASDLLIIISMFSNMIGIFELQVLNRPVLGLWFILLWRGFFICLVTITGIILFGLLVFYVDVYLAFQILSGLTLLNIFLISSCHFFGKL